jgi:hypothetical protein
VETVTQGGLWSLLGQKLNSYLAFRLLRIGQAAQALGKLGHEAPQTVAPRWWTLPVAGPAIVSIATAARLLDRFVPEETEALGFLVVAQHRRSAPGRDTGGRLKDA